MKHTLHLCLPMQDFLTTKKKLLFYGLNRYRTRPDQTHKTRPNQQDQQDQTIEIMRFRPDQLAHAYETLTKTNYTRPVLIQQLPVKTKVVARDTT